MKPTSPAGGRRITKLSKITSISVNDLEAKQAIIN
jgi:hypothetical protein